MSNIYPVASLKVAGVPTNRWNLVFVADGYQQSELNLFLATAQQLLNYLQTQNGYINYLNFFNAYALSAPSTQSGASHPHNCADCPPLTTQPVAVVTNTFKSTFDYSGIHRWLYADTTLVDTALTANFTWYKPNTNTIPITVVNAAYYGGSQVGNHVTIPGNNTSAGELLMNELHKALTGVGDEFALNSYAAWNIWTSSDITTAPWKLWQGTTGIGMFPVPGPGWIPTNQTCKEFALGKPFCPICVERLVVACNNYNVNLIDSYTPATTTTLTAGGSQTFSLSCIQPNPDTLSVTWTLDGVNVGTGYNYTLQNDTQLPGIHVVVATVQDVTALAKAHLTPHAQKWNITTVKPLPIPTPPAAPTGLTTSGSAVSLICQPVTGATHYGFVLQNGATQVSSVPGATFTGLAAKSNYSATVTVTTGAGTSQPSLPFTFTTP